VHKGVGTQQWRADPPNLEAAAAALESSLHGHKEVLAMHRRLDRHDGKIVGTTLQSLGGVYTVLGKVGVGVGNGWGVGWSGGG
jgi:hypothetical protein